ncbi:hypothetical protein QLG14_20640 [Pseudomonas sp. V104_10]|uniref:hypothetical protein n=1 Tax=Pseudomonas sp. V104_10 TaxID=3044231 RepID=UPI00249DCAC1|nr:hypothetical protein [Pseudomonas sp. V104_10]MDI3371649.1 hypothetical protein [Pseudomonas sp. V104_10]
MIELFSNPEWWITIAVGAVVSAVLPRACKGCRNLGAWTMNSAKGKLQAWMRCQKRKRLIKIKSKRFDSLAINREVVLSYALFIIFVIVSIATLAAIGNLQTPKSSSEPTTIILGLFLAIPALIFEIAWLNASNRVDELLKYRKRIRRSRQKLC